MSADMSPSDLLREGLSDSSRTSSSDILSPPTRTRTKHSSGLPADEGAVIVDAERRPEAGEGFEELNERDAESGDEESEEEFRDDERYPGTEEPSRPEGTSEEESDEVSSGEASSGEASSGEVQDIGLKMPTHDGTGVVISHEPSEGSDVPSSTVPLTYEEVAKVMADAEAAVKGVEVVTAEVAAVRVEVVAIKAELAMWKHRAKASIVVGMSVLVILGAGAWKYWRGGRIRMSLVKVNWDIMEDDTPVTQQTKFEYMAERRKAAVWKRNAWVLMAIIAAGLGLYGAWISAWAVAGRLKKGQ
ncbi:hypothetical protein LTR17_010724 [Elasticomyces elasticus]|nr:hypothetical protein LTR17_010724 [Elasticomyces elasticus]